MTPAQIHSLRHRLGDTANGFAKRLGLKGRFREVTIYRWESGARRPSFKNLTLMSQLKNSKKQ